MRVILYFTCFAICISESLSPVFAQSKSTAKSEKEKLEARKKQEMDSPFQSILYFPLLLEENYEQTGPQFQKAIDKFYETKNQRQAFLRSLADEPEIGFFKSEVNELGEEVGFMPVSLMIDLCKFDKERLKQFFDNYLFLGKDGFEKPQEKPAAKSGPYLGTTFSRTEVVAGARSMEQERDKFKNDVSANRRSPVIQSMLANENYAIIHPENQWPVFADVSLYGQGAGDYELNRERYLVSLLALLSAYPDIKERLNSKYLEWIFNPKYWNMLYDHAIETYQSYDQQLLKKYLGYNQIAQ